MPTERSSSRSGWGCIASPSQNPHRWSTVLGWGDVKVYEALTDLVMKYTAAPNAKRPNVEDWYTNKYAGKIKLTPDEWSKVSASAAPYAKYLA